MFDARRAFRWRHALIVVACLVPAGLVAAQPTIDPDAVLVDGRQGSVGLGVQGDGWNADAFRFLTDALAFAADQGKTEVWVRACDADGSLHPDYVQYPDRSSANPAGTDDPADFFDLPPRITIYGGFSGTEIERKERNPELHESILSGNIGSLASRSDNSHTVVVRRYIDDEIDEESQLHGVVVEDGEAKVPATIGSPPDPALLEAYRWNVAGGAIFEERCFIVRCVFRRNEALAGGAILDLVRADVTLGPSSLEVRCSTFHDNRATGTSAAVALPDASGGGLDTGTVFGGGVLAGGGVVKGLALFSNVIAHDNAATVASGGVIGFGGAGGGATLKHCTFTGNASGSDRGGAIWISAGGIGAEAELDIENSIVWENSTAATAPSLFERNVFLANSPGATVFAPEHSIMQGAAGAGVPPTTPATPDTLLDVDPIFVDAGLRDFRLQAISPAVDAGDELLAAADDRDVDDDDDLGEQEPDREIGVRTVGAEADLGAIEYCPKEAADIDDDRGVGFDDLLLLLAQYGVCTGTCSADLDGDGTVGFADLLILLEAWGWCEAEGEGGNEAPESVTDCIEKVGTSDPQVLAACIEAMLRLEAGE